VRRWRKVRRSCWVPQRSSGRLLAAAGGDGHGGKLGYWEFFSRGARESGQGGREKKGGFFVAFNGVFRR
jgi:hypothetical protein